MPRQRFVIRVSLQGTPAGACCPTVYLFTCMYNWTDYSADLPVRQALSLTKGYARTVAGGGAESQGA